MPTKVYVEGQYPSYEAQLMKGHGVRMDAGSGKLTLAKLSRYDELAFLNPQRIPSQEEQLAVFEFASEGGGILINLYSHGKTDFEKRMKHPFWKALSNSEFSYLKTDPYVVDLKTDNGEPLEIECFFMEEFFVPRFIFFKQQRYKPVNRKNFKITELAIPKEEVLFYTFITDSTFGTEGEEKVDIGDDVRNELEKIEISDTEHVKVILKREIKPNFELANRERIEIYVREVTEYPFISEKSYDDISINFYDEKKNTHNVAILNDKIDSQYVSSLGKDLVPNCEVVTIVGLPFADRYADKNVYPLSKILKHLGSLRKDLIREEVLEETNEVKPQEQSETSPPQTRKRVVPITSLYKHSEQQN